MTTLAEFMIIAGADNRPPMLEKSMTKKYEELSVSEKLQADCDLKATNIVLQGLAPDVYDIVNHHKVAKDIWDKVKLLMQGTKLSLQERECKLYDEFDKLSFVMGETLYHLSPEWSKFVMDVKLARDLHTTNYDQLYSYLEQLEEHENETRLMRERYQDPLAFEMIPSTKAMAFLSAVAASSSHQPTINLELPLTRETRPPFKTTGLLRQARVVKCYNYQGEGQMARQCTQSKRPRNAAWFKDKAMLAEAQESGQILDEEQLAFLADPCIPDCQAAQTTIPNNAAFQTKDLDAYDSNCDDVSNAKAALMANLFNYGLDVILE
ncbi:hypothetical protein Tco_1396875, partial [Tanacetum coccineum]